MSKKNRAAIYLEYIAALIFIQVIRILPWGAAHSIGRMLGSVCFYLIPSRTKIAKENLSIAFSKKSKKEISDIVFKSWQNIGQTLIEFIKQIQLDKKNFSKYCSVEGLENIEKAVADRKGIICLGSHYFNWEIINLALSMLGYNIKAIARPLENPLLNKMVTDIRQYYKGEIIPHRQAIKEGIKHLKKNGLVGILIDQYYGSGVEVDFFSKKTFASPIIAALSNRVGSAVLPMRSFREKNKLVIQIQPAVVFPFCEDVQEFYKVSTQILTKIIEDWVREKPAGWFWVHRRWR
ncbi:MAG: lysophospholipid acyltransferase family protein [bacterium]